MSILKQVLKETWSSLGRQAPAEKPGDRATQAETASTADQAHVPASAGMKVVILNWKAGENDPFTFINDTIRHHFQACGKNVETIEITDLTWPGRLAELAPAGVAFAFTWQGLGSHIVVGDGKESLWDHLKIPLICIHGDHPAHMPRNHQLESPYCFHLYTNAEFARYSNRHFRRKRGASIIDLPQLHREPRLKDRSGDYFVVAKNIQDPSVTETRWRETLQKPVLDAYMMAAETLKARIATEPYVEIHDALDELLTRHGFEWLTLAINIDAYHAYHSQLDHYLRSHKSIAAVKALREFPVRIYGRGWERIAKTAPPSHAFEPGRNMVDSQAMFYSTYGLVDVSPSKGLHDRTRRAMANGVGFLSSANLEDSFVDIERFQPLFFRFPGDELAEKAATALRNPAAHAALAERFALAYHEKFHFKGFVSRLEQLAKLAIAAFPVSANSRG